MVKFIIHGGCGAREAPKIPFMIYHEKLSEITHLGVEFSKTHSTQELALYLAHLLEDESIFNAGTGSRVQKDGEIRMSAAYMDSQNEKFSGVINIQNIKNPSFVAYKLQGEYNSVLSSVEATQYATEKLNHETYNPMTKMRWEEYQNELKGYTGTIGVVVLECENQAIFAITFTGGIGFESPGRVGDTPTVAGTYASKILGISCTGKGEQIVNQGLAVRVETRVRDGATLEEAAMKSILEAEEKGYYFGFIAIDVMGNIFATNTSQAQTFYSIYDGTKVYTFLDKLAQ
ncbi:MAG: isoaspartyl peptidase/L-asparaginase [Fusobacteria bacterium]|nr:isoaspartyl peptidase/L-asparaginase [Fusobacteriota bacterium]